MKTAIQHEAEVNSFVYKILDHEFMDESVDFFFDVFLKGRCWVEKGGVSKSLFVFKSQDEVVKQDVRSTWLI